MTSKSITLQVHPRGKPIKKLPETVNIDANATGTDLYKLLAARTQYPIYQLRVSKAGDGSAVPNSKDVTLHNIGLRDQSTLHVKDLGLQIAWRTVFVIEYFGPILIHPLVYHFRPYIYPSAPKEASQLQTIFCWLVVLHFVKRELETLFVHRFSSATMPAFNILKNSGHYWGLSGIVMAAWAYSPWFATAKPANPLFLYPGLAMYIVGEIGNLHSHLVLRSLRSPGGTERGIPRGTFFNMVTCPNYFFEVWIWMGVYLVSGLAWGNFIFIIPAVLQMWVWGKKKERRYRKEFGDKYKSKRYVVFPGLL